VTDSHRSRIMTAAGTYRRFPLFVIGALALVAALACCPSARAACGDYVTVIGAHRPADVPLPAPPCHGPGCSRAPTQAAPVSAPKLAEPPAPVGLADRNPVPPRPGHHRHGSVKSLSPSSRHPSDIFHPPRAA
jgi:hypothetical protein